MALHVRGKTPTQIANNLGCSRGQVYRTIKRGTAKAYKKNVQKTVRTPDLIPDMRDAVEENKDMTMSMALLGGSGKTGEP